MRGPIRPARIDAVEPSTRVALVEQWVGGMSGCGLAEFEPIHDARKRDTRQARGVQKRGLMVARSFCAVQTREGVTNRRAWPSPAQWY